MLLSAFMVRRLKRDVLATLPRKTEATLYVPMSATQCELSRQLLLSGAKVLSRMQAQTEEGAKHAEANRDWVQMQSLLISLRKCCNHPQLFGEWMGEVSHHTLTLGGPPTTYHLPPTTYHLPPTTCRSLLTLLTPLTTALLLACLLTR